MPFSWFAISLAGARDTSVWGINNAGRIVGGFGLAVEPPWGGGRRRGFLESSAGTFITITGPKSWGEKIWKYLLRGHFRTTAQGINDAGQIVGTFWSGHGHARGFLRTPEGTVTVINVPGATDGLEPNVGGTRAHGINDAGQIVGFFSDAAGKQHGYLRTPGGTFTTIDVPGATGTGATAINSRGQVVGFFRDTAGKHHGYLRTPDGTPTIIDAPGATNTTAWGINDAGQVVGAFSDAAGTGHGFLRTTDGAFTIIDAPGATATIAIGVNNIGQIVGFLEEANHESRGFVATPAHESSAGVAQRTLADEEEKAPPRSRSLRRFRESLAGIMSMLLILGILPMLAFGLIIELARFLVPSMTLAYVARLLERGVDIAIATVIALTIVTVFLMGFVVARHAITYVLPRVYRAYKEAARLEPTHTRPSIPLVGSCAVLWILSMAAVFALFAPARLLGPLTPAGAAREGPTAFLVVSVFFATGAVTVWHAATHVLPRVVRAHKEADRLERLRGLKPLWQPRKPLWQPRKLAGR